MRSANLFSTRRVAGVVSWQWLLAGLAVLPTITCVAQEPVSKEQSELVDGLLDLLSEPASDATPRTTPPPIQAPTDAQTSGAGPDEQLLNSSLVEHPLRLVHNNMRAAASRLGKGVVEAETRQLQFDIIQGLDQLIVQLQQADPQQSPQTQSQQQPPSSAQTAQPSEPSATAGAPTAEGDGVADLDQQGDRQPNGSELAQDSTSRAGTAPKVSVDLADPERLQQDVWGQLPEQVRKQMQSRMVERFLPSHRPQIEAYFRALLQGERR